MAKVTVGKVEQAGTDQKGIQVTVDGVFQGWVLRNAGNPNWLLGEHLAERYGIELPDGITNANKVEAWVRAQERELEAAQAAAQAEPEPSAHMVGEDPDDGEEEAAELTDEETGGPLYREPRFPEGLPAGPGKSSTTDDPGPKFVKRANDDQILALRRAGKSFRQIAAEVGMSHIGVKSALIRLGMHKNTPRKPKVAA